MGLRMMLTNPLGMNVLFDIDFWEDAYRGLELRPLRHEMERGALFIPTASRKVQTGSTTANLYAGQQS
jgi:hypothetical protein